MHPSPKTILLLLLCGLGVCVKAQTVWNKTYIEDRPTMRFSSVISSDSTYKMIGVTVNKLAPYYEQVLMIKTDTNGNLLGYKSSPDTIGINTGTYWNTLIRTNKNEFAFAGYGTDTTQHLIFGIANNAFDSVHIYRYYTPNTLAFQGAGLICKGNFKKTNIQ